VSWLAVRCAGEHYLLPLGQSGEIFPIGMIQPVPYVRAWFRGVVNLRGGLFGVIDLAGFLAGDDGAPLRPLPQDPVVVTFSSALDVNSAVLVDALAGLRSPESFSAVQPPPADAPACLGNRFTDAAGQHWQEINLQSLSQMPRFLTITA
jgi:twitching motility protein PilI